MAINEEKSAKIMRKILENNIIAKEQHILNLLKIGYFILKTKMPFIRYEQMGQFFYSMLHENQNLDLSHLSAKSFIEVMTSLNYVIQAETIKNIKASPFYSIIIDETSDRTNKTQLIIYIKYQDLECKKTKIDFISLLRLKSTYGISIFKV